MSSIPEDSTTLLAQVVRFRIEFFFLFYLTHHEIEQKLIQTDMIHTDKIYRIRIVYLTLITFTNHTNEVIIATMMKFPFTLKISTGCGFDKIGVFWFF